MIQTHEYKQRRQNKKIHVSLFKREGTLTGIVPLCIYTTYGFEYPDSIYQKIRFPIDIQVVQVNYKNMGHFHDFMKENIDKFAIFGTTHLGNIMELLKTGNLFITLWIDEGEIAAAYFFRKTCVFLTSEMTKDSDSVSRRREILNCFASIYAKDLNIKKKREFFIGGFNKSVQYIQKKNPAFQYITIEDISDNNVLLKYHWLTGHYDKMPTAYFFYNFAHSSFRPEKVFFLF